MTPSPEPVSRPGGWPEDTPPRSALFGLTPEGFSGETFEELSSYFRRLCDRHGLPPWTLAFHAVTPLIRGWDYNAARRCYDLTICGAGEPAAQWSSALKRLTLRHDLQLTTLLPLSSVVPNYGLISPVERFCPRCYADDERAGRQKYNRLLWAIKCVTACPVHGLALKRVPQAQRGVGQMSCLPGVSAFDGSSLANEVAQEARPHQIRIAWLIAELLDHSHLHPESFSQTSAIPDFLRHANELLFGGNIPDFSRYLGTHTRSLRMWMRGSIRPTLDWLVVIAYCCDVSVADVLHGNQKMLRKLAPPPLGDVPHSQKTRRGRTKKSEAFLIAALDKLLESETVTSQKQAADALGISRTYLSKIAPRQTAFLVEFGKQYRRRVAEATEDEKFAEYWQSHNSLTDAGIYASVRKVLADVRARTQKTFSYDLLSRVIKRSKIWQAQEVQNESTVRNRVANDRSLHRDSVPEQSVNGLASLARTTNSCRKRHRQVNSTDGAPGSPKTLVAEGSQSRTDPGVSDTPNRV